MEEREEMCEEGEEDMVEKIKLSEEEDGRSNLEKRATKQNDPHAFLGKKSKMILTILCYGLYTATAFETAMLGPSLVDLEMRLNTNTETISYMFTLQGCMSLLTSLLIGPVFDRIDGYLLVSIGGFISAAFLSVSLWNRNLISFLCLFTPTGIQAVIASIAVSDAMLAIWKENSAVYLQILNFIYSVALAIGPLLVEPFLVGVEPPLNVVDTNDNKYNSTKSFVGLETQDELFQDLNQQYEIQRNVTNQPDLETNVQYLYLLSGLYHMFWSVCMLGAFFVYFGKIKRERISTESVDRKPVNKRFFMYSCVLFFFFTFCFSGIELCFPWYLMTFVVKYLGWSKRMGIYITLLFQIANILATFCCIFLVKWVKVTKILFVAIFICIVSTLSLSLSANSSDAMVWVCTVGIGLGYSTIFPSTYAAISLHITIRGTFSYVYWCGYFVGQVCIPPLIGYCFEEIDPMSFIYILCCCSAVLLVTFVLFQVLVRHFKLNENHISTHKDIHIDSTNLDSTVPDIDKAKDKHF